MSQVVFITGCSSGIGRDLAQRLSQSGYTVVATARKVESLENIQAALKLPLDVTKPKSIDQAVERTLKEFGRIDVLVNNAGYTIYGAVEEVSDEQVQQMFDVNVFGVLRMVRAVAPHMRQQGAGRIINISSIVGKLPFPVNGTYSSTKFALEALSDALRLELVEFGIQVVLIEPGGIRTHFVNTAQAHSQDLFANLGSPYHSLYQRFLQVHDSMNKQSPGPEAVSQVVQQAIEAPRPKARYVAAFGFSGKLVMLLGGSVWDMVLRKMLGIKG